MENNITEQIKNEGIELIKNGKSASRATHILFDKYSDGSSTYSQFEGKYGRFLRRYVQNHGGITKTQPSGKIISFPKQQDKQNNRIQFPQQGVTPHSTITRNEDGTILLDIAEPAKKDKDGNYRSENEILVDNNISPAQFKISSYQMSRWEAQTKDEGIVDMEAYKLKVAPRTIEDCDWLKSYEDMAQKFTKILPIRPTKAIDGEEIAVIAIPDLHLAKFAEKEVCGESYNTEKAVLAFNQIIGDSVRLIKARDVEKIVFFWSQDFFHFDTVDKTTTAGTRQDSDIGWQKMYDLGLELLVSGIKTLAELAPVETFYVRSNHDTQTGFHAACALKYLFMNDERVTISSDPSPRHYIEYGVNLMGFAHGDKEKKRIETLMQLEAAESWGRTYFREWFLGHFHSLHQYESGGIVFRYLQSPTGTDEWHAGCGYKGAWKCGYIFIRNKKYGPILEMPLMVLEDRLKGREAMTMPNRMAA